MNKSSILIVDDDPSNFEVIETFLSSRQYDLHYVASGKDAIALLDTYQPDLILLDVMMPGIDGREVCRQIKGMSKWQAVPIIMVTALNSKSDLADCLDAGADDFISKPINAIELRARVQSMLRIKQQYDNIETLSQIQKNTINILQSTLNEAKKFLIYLELELSVNPLLNSDSARTLFSAATVAAALKNLAQNFNRRQDLGFELAEAEVAIPAPYLSMILQELVDNALKFSPPSTAIKVTSHVEGEKFNLFVHDSGSGMTDEQIAQINIVRQFEPSASAQQRVAMGLKIVKKIVELVGGEFSITSVNQQGTTVHLTLPIAQSLSNS
ncbi:response regulator [Phormidium sp. LEGE 05292]|uniref:hybrid sensor histidine kinase/response regulator n=1 Tax=[Phormidium] sp. LEGE 05292 TaxID=767427 RepID=UPI0018828425|nr:response regulator [Phormidium sp. LEGE 05292]MBE9228884.1 response regulator [Phormidium sp. LEGE 05292]